MHEVTVPAGTRLAVILDTGVGSDTSRLEQPVEGHLSRPIMVDGVETLPEGTQVRGIVTDATRSAKVKGRASVGVRFDSLVPVAGGERYQIETEAIERTAAATKGKGAAENRGGAVHEQQGNPPGARRRIHGAAHGSGDDQSQGLEARG